jgi:DNA polymerase-3 subunit gamma/tau
VQAAVRRGRGSARDALSALDQVVASGSSDSARPELSGILSALSQGEAADVLVSLSSLLAAGWGPQQLATELVDDLRQVFLAALAPELCAVSGPSRAEFTALAESTGLARVVRSMEIMGRALIDMRDAPDAQVVLEIAAVRAARADLDPGMEALTERVAMLERAMVTGAAPAQVPPRSEEVAHSASAPPAESAPRPPTSPTDVARRPSLGAVRRRQEAPDEAQADAEPPPARRVRAQAEAPGPQPVNGPSRRAASPTVDRDGLTQAWGDGVLRNLPARAKALFSAGRFVAADESGARFALPNAAHRDRCAELAPQVEEALAAHFGVPVSLVLVVDDGSAGAPVRGGVPAPPAEPEAPGPDDLGELDEEDPTDLLVATGEGLDQASAAEARLREAFPGTSEESG